MIIVFAAMTYFQEIKMMSNIEARLKKRRIFGDLERKNSLRRDIAGCAGVENKRAQDRKEIEHYRTVKDKTILILLGCASD